MSWLFAAVLLGLSAPAPSQEPAATLPEVVAHQKAEPAGRGITVAVDAWFNSQKRKNAAGAMEYFHYKWEDTSNDGFSMLGEMFRADGAQLATIYEAPTAANLQDKQLYLIASPDIPKKNPSPHYMRGEDADEIARWVREGGTLVMLENDPANADFEHFNQLADRFGLHFDPVLRHHVVDKDIENGRIPVAGDGEIFKQAHVLYMKDTCRLLLSGKARALVQDRGDVVMAMARYGKGSAIAVVDPWLYNEYVNGRNLPSEYDNHAAGLEFVHWVLMVARHHTHQK